MILILILILMLVVVLINLNLAEYLRLRQKDCYKSHSAFYTISTSSDPTPQNTQNYTQFLSNHGRKTKTINVYLFYVVLTKCYPIVVLVSVIFETMGGAHHPLVRYESSATHVTGVRFVVPPVH